jgi:osmotically-inducible protein OsmY
MSLQKFCERPAVTIAPEQNIVEACRLMREKNDGCLAALEGEKLRGILIDLDIARAAVTALEWSIPVPHDRITVTVRHGWVTLEGSVNWPYQKSVAEDTVRHLMGVRGVTNAIKVQPTVLPADISAKIEEAFKRNAILEARKVWVETQDSKVLLRGNLHSRLERAEAKRVTAAAAGVTEVENHIKITL